MLLPALGKLFHNRQTPPDRDSKGQLAFCSWTFVVVQSFHQKASGIIIPASPEQFLLDNMIAEHSEICQVVVTSPESVIYPNYGRLALKAALKLIQGHPTSVLWWCNSLLLIYHSLLEGLVVYVFF